MLRFIKLGLLVLTPFSFTFGQKDCSFDNTGKIPLIDLAGGYFNGVAGGLYPGGTNSRPPEHLAKCIEHVSLIQPLNTAGNPDPNGKVVMLGIGASNPMVEFQQFKEFSEAFDPLNDALEIINACQGGIAIQKMYEASDTFWIGVDNLLEDNGLNPKQVQVIWVEQENTNSYDTLFNTATTALVNDFLRLMKVIKLKFPNAQICYVSARTYAGYADPIDPELSKGLLYPRDYFNGWAIKRLVENVINATGEYDYEGVDAIIPLVTWGTYNWTDGSTPRNDGMFLDCYEDTDPDGLHLSGVGKYKFGQYMFDYFKTDTTAQYWYYDEGFLDIKNQDLAKSEIMIVPNPASGNTIKFNTTAFLPNEQVNYQIADATGKLITTGIGYGNENIDITINDLPSGLYTINAFAESGVAAGRFIVTH